MFKDHLASHKLFGMNLKLTIGIYVHPSCDENSDRSKWIDFLTICYKYSVIGDNSTLSKDSSNLCSKKKKKKKNSIAFARE